MELQAWIGGLPIARGFGCGCDDADNLFQQAVASQLPTTVIPRPTSTEVASRTVSNSQLVVPGTVTYFVWSSNACRYKRLYGPLEYGVHTKADGIEIRPIFKRGPSKVNSCTLNKTIIKPKII
jgi:hypothetical protein